MRAVPGGCLDAMNGRRKASDSVLDALARALQLDDAERAHLFDVARAARPIGPPPRRRTTKHAIRPSVCAAAAVIASSNCCTP